MTEIEIDFTNGADRFTFERTIFEIRKRLDVEVESFSDNRGLWGNFRVRFVGAIEPDEASSLYSGRLSPRTRASIESMKVHTIDPTSLCSYDRHMSSIWIDFTDGITRSTFKSVLSEVERKFGARIVSSYKYKLLDGFHAELAASVEPDRAFVLYSRRLSLQARRFIKSMDVWRIDLPRDVMDKFMSYGFRIDAPLPVEHIIPWLSSGFDPVYEDGKGNVFRFGLWRGPDVDDIRRDQGGPNA